MTEKPAILGGKPVRINPLPSRKTMGEEEKKAVLEVMETDTLSAFIGGPGKFFNGGTKVLEFEESWTNKYGFKHAISVNSWTSGLIIAVGAVGIEPGDEVICSPYTMSASATAALFYGGIPVFADIDPENCCIDPKSFESKITPRTKAIIVVHIFGGTADMDEIMRIARKYKIKVIEDAAQAPGVRYKGTPIGAIGDIGGFSLNFHKHIHTGEGGMLVTNDDEVALKARLIRNHGENCVESIGMTDISNTIGGNYRLTELQSAIGIEQLKKLDALFEIRNDHADFLNRELAGVKGLSPLKVIENTTHAYYIFPFSFNAAEAGLSRGAFVKAVNAEFPSPEGFESVPLVEAYVKPLYLAPLYQKQIAIGKKGFPFTYNKDITYNYSPGICPVAEHMYDKEMVFSPIIREPLTQEDIKDFSDAVKKVLNHATEIAKEYSTENEEVMDSISTVNKTNIK